MLSFLREWRARRRLRQRRIRVDAQRLSATNAEDAYYEAHRHFAKARTAGDPAAMVHWASVAAEIARIEPRAEMDFGVVLAIDDAEKQAHTRL